jgi:hypothetical protein
MRLSQELDKAILDVKRNDFDRRPSSFTQAAFGATKVPDYLIDFKRSKEGWPLQYYLGRPEPLRARPNIEIVFPACWIKKIIVNLIYDFKNKGIFGKLGVLLSIGLYYNYLIDTAYYGAGEFIRAKDKLSQAPREFQRVLEIWGEKIRDIITIILEGDPAYRYRLQDITGNLNKEALKKSPRKEIIRLAKILMDRENGDNSFNRGMKGKWDLVSKVINLSLLVNWKLKNKIRDTLLELNLDEIKLSKEDLYWCDLNKDYNFGGLTAEERKQRHINIYGEEQTKLDYARI